MSQEDKLLHAIFGKTDRWLEIYNFLEVDLRGIEGATHIARADGHLKAVKIQDDAVEVYDFTYKKWRVAGRESSDWRLVGTIEECEKIARGRVRENRTRILGTRKWCRS